MVSHNSFRVMGYIYAGVSLVGSLLLIINSSHKITELEVRSSVYDNQSGRRVVGTSLTVLLISMIAMIYDIMLIFGMFMRRENLVYNHLRFIGGACGLLVTILFICSIVSGIVIEGEGEAISAAIIALTIIHIMGITTVTVLSTFIAWVLQGVIECIKQDKIRLVSGSNDSLF